MADVQDDPFTPAPNTEDYSTPQAQGMFQSFLNDPRGQAALLQAGLSLMGGRTWGDNPTSQIARAIGSAGEAVRGQETATQQAAESASLISERGSRAAAREEAARQAEERTDIARQRLGLDTQKAQDAAERHRRDQDLNEKKYSGLIAIAQGKLDNAKDETERKKARDEVDRLFKEQRAESLRITDNYRRDLLTIRGSEEEGRRTRADTTRDTALRQLHEKYLARIEKANQAADLYGRPRQVPKTFEEWKLEQGVGGGGGGPTTAPPAPSSTQPPAPRQPGATRRQDETPSVGQERPFSTKGGGTAIGVWDGSKWVPKAQYRGTTIPADTTEPDDTED